MALIPFRVTWTVFLPSSVCSISSAIAATYLYHLMIRELNEKLPDKDKIGAFFGYPGEPFKIERLHRQYYPQSRLRVVINVVIAVSLLCFLVAGRAIR